jgi:ABC-type Fe3+-hydroxamate transport system substrate-binding protein
MPSGDDSLPMAVFTAQDRDLKPLAEESAELLDLDDRQAEVMQSFLHDAWFLGIRTGHRIMVETKMGQEGDPMDVIADMQSELRDLMERLGAALNTTVRVTTAAWNYLGQAWIAGSKFWEVEITARLIESQAGDFGEALRRLEG